MHKDSSEPSIRRMATMLEKSLGRELTPEERKFLAFSTVADPLDESDLQPEIEEKRNRQNAEEE